MIIKLNGLHLKRGGVILPALIILLYSALHAAWVAEQPPIRNDDHFHTEIVLGQLATAGLYPRDPAWADTTFAENHGFLFIGALRIGEKLGGDYHHAWPILTFALYFVYLSGFYLFFRALMAESGAAILRDGLALSLSLISTIPLYLAITFAHWGLASVYAHSFVTACAGWLLYGFLTLLRRESSSAGYWFILGAAAGLLIYFNPVNGGGLIGILTLVIGVEALGGRIKWLSLAAWLIGAGLGMLPYVANYAGALSPAESPSAEQIATAKAFIIELAGQRLYPWTLPPTLAPIVLSAAALMALVLLLRYNKLDRPIPRPVLMMFLAAQIIPLYLLSGSLTWLLILAYGWWRAQKIDRIDRLLFAFLAAANLIGPITNALGHLMWAELGLEGAFTLAYEPIRLARWGFLIVYALVGRWIWFLVREAETGQKSVFMLRWMAAALLLATITAYFGSANPVKDDAVLMKTILPLRWALPFLALGLIWLSEREQPIKWPNMAAGLFGLMGLGFFLTMQPWENISAAGVGILILLGVSAALWLKILPKTIRPPRIILVFALLTLALPLAGYHKAKPDLNYCDFPQLTDCATAGNIEAGAAWLREHSPLDAKVHVIGMQPERFQPMAQRSTLHVNLYQIFWFRGAAALLDTLPLRDELASMNPLRPNYAGDAALIDLLRREDARYVVVVGADYALTDFTLVYENPELRIYQDEP